MQLDVLSWNEQVQLDFFFGLIVPSPWKGLHCCDMNELVRQGVLQQDQDR